jgi:hypothetical protein
VVAPIAQGSRAAAEAPPLLARLALEPSGVDAADRDPGPPERVVVGVRAPKRVDPAPRIRLRSAVDSGLREE